MKTLITFLILTISSFCSSPLSAELANVSKSSNINIWYETFGKKEDPAFLLIMGSGGQGIYWPTPFCEKLAHEGYYVIRYDHRDAGLSTCFDFEKTPYDLLDMTYDAIGLLDALNIPKAHLVGLSMGGPIAELVAIHFPQKVLTLTLMSTSADFRPINLFNAGLPAEVGALSGPSEFYATSIQEIIKTPRVTEEEKIEQKMAIWDLMSGADVPEDKNLNYAMQKEFLSRGGNPLALQNYRQAMRRSENLVKEAPFQVKVPTLIFQGSSDPFFREDHGMALLAAIAGSKYICVRGMGHLPNSHFFNLLIEEIQGHAK